MLYCICLECTMLQDKPVPRKEIHVELGPCSCSNCSALRKEQELAWEARLQKYIEAVKIVQALNENTICSTEQLNAIDHQYEGNAVMQLLTNNIRYFRALTITKQRNEAVS